MNKGQPLKPSAEADPGEKIISSITAARATPVKSVSAGTIQLRFGCLAKLTRVSVASGIVVRRSNLRGCSLFVAKILYFQPHPGCPVLLAAFEPPPEHGSHSKYRRDF